MPKAFGPLILTLREFIGDLEGSYTQELFQAELAARGEIMSITTFGDAENSGNKHDRVIDQITAMFSDRLSDLWMNRTDSAKFDPLKWYRLAFAFNRLMQDITPILLPEHMIMNRPDRFLVGSYDITLRVAPCIGGTRIIERSGLSPESFPYDNIARVTYQLRFAEDNRRKDPGFNLAYITKEGRIELTKPSSSRLIDDRNYPIHKKGVNYRPHPEEEGPHQFEVLVFGGYNPSEKVDSSSTPSQETAHFSMAQPAVYDQVSFTLDLSAYPADAFQKNPELIIVPILKDNDRDCCQIAQDGDGMILKPKKVNGLIWRWEFEGVADVMICVRWQTKAEKIQQANLSPHDALIRVMTDR